MKLIFCLALVGTALALRLDSEYSPWQPSPRISEYSFRAGREFRYLFDGQVSTGLTLPTSQHSASRIQALIALQPLDDYSTLLQITQIRFGSIQSELEQRRLLAFEQFDLVQLEAKHEELLALPLRFVYKQGMISDIFFSHYEEPWSANIKRAVLNMLQINLQRGQTDLTGNKISDIQSDPFVAVERTLEGECEVMYTRTVLSDDQMQWTKSINYQKCVSRPEVFYGRQFTERCEGCERKTSEEILSSSLLTFNVTGNSKNFLIQSVELNSQHIFAPLSEKQQLIASFGCNKLMLVYAGDTETMIKETRGVKESLIYSPDMELAEEKFAMTGEEKYLRRIPQWNNKVEHVQKLITTLVKHIDEQIDLETSHIVARLVKLLRMATEEEINRIHRFLYDSKKFDERTMGKVHSIYNDALAMAGTKVTITHLVDKIIKKFVQPLKAARLLKSLVDLRTPSQEIADEIVRLCDSDIATRNPIVKQSCFLTYGSVINGLCGESTERMAIQYNSKKGCTRQVKEKFVRKLTEQYDRSETQYEKILVIKTLANAAIDTSIYELEKIIANKRIEKTLRVQALDALRKLRFVLPRKIQNILMPIYKDHTDSPEVRMAALYQIMHTIPEKVLIDQIVDNIVRDRSRQVRLFTYSLLKSISESKNPCEKKLSSWVTKALGVLPELERNMLDSRHISWTAFSSGYEAGATINWAAIFSNDSILPKEVMASVDSLLGGQWNKHLIQVGFLQHNFDLVLHNVLDKIEKSGLEQLIVRGKRSTVSRPTEILRSLYQKLRINRRQLSKDEAHAMLYIRYKDMDYAILPVDLETIPDLFRNIVRDGKIELGDIERLIVKGSQFHTTGAFFFHESARQIPTTLGLPIIMTSKMPTVGSIQGYLKMEFMPKNSVHLDGLRLRLVAKPFVAATNIIKVEVTSPIFNSGVKLLHSAKLHAPVDVNFEINWQKVLTVKTTIKTPESKKYIAHFESRPVTFVRVWKKATRAYPETVEQTIFLRDTEYSVSTFDCDYFENYGLKAVVSGSIRQQPFPISSNLLMPILIGENMIDLTIEPTNDSPSEFVFQMNVEVFEPIERIEKHDLFEIEHGKYKDESENKHRTAFNTYLKSLDVDKAYKHRIVLKAETVGSRVNHEAQAVISSVCDAQVRYCTFQIDAHRTPITGENRRWEMTAFVQALYPKIPNTLSELYDQLNREFHGLLKARWGSEEKNAVTIRVHGEQSREQMKWMEDVVKYRDMIAKEQKLTEASELNLYRAVIDYELSAETNYQLNKLLSLFKFWNLLNTDYQVVKNMEGHVELKLNIEPETRSIFNMTVVTPTERLLFQDLQIPFRLPAINIHSYKGDVHGMKTVLSTLIKKPRPECIVKSNEIQTFDNLFFKAPISSCYVVLAKDCSSEKPRFAVLMKKLSMGSEEKRLKVISRQNLIEIELVNNELIAKVNGNDVGDERNMENYGILKKNNQLYKVDIDDVIITFDGYQAKIELSPLFKSKQCGICGHYDGEEMNDFRGADNVETSDIGKFHRSFIAEDEECEKDETSLFEKNNYKVIRPNIISDEQNDLLDAQEPILRTEVLEVGQRVCFSIEPVTKCPIKTQHIGKLQKEDVEFNCIPRSHSETFRLMRIARKQVISRDLLYSVDAHRYSKLIALPTMCTVY